MRWAFFFLLFCASVHAEGLPVPAPVAPAPRCAPWYARLGTAAKDKVVGVARGARDSMVELKDNVRREGPLRIMVRQRSEAEKAMGYRAYFVAPPAEKPAPRYLVTKALAQLKKVNPLRNLTPIRGVVNSLDRVFLRNHTATNGIRGTLSFTGGLAATVVASEYLYEKPMAYLEEKIPFERAVREGLAYEYAFASLRKAVAAGKLSAEKAEAAVAEEYHARGRYFNLVRLGLEATGAQTMEDIAPQFVEYLNAPELGSSLKDLRQFLSEDFAKNPRMRFTKAGPVTPEQYRQLFALNHAKLYGSYSLNDWMQPGFKAASLPANSAAEAIHREVTKDPFRARLIAYQKANPAAVPMSKLVAWLSEDFEWATRFAELDVLGAGIRTKPNEDTVLTLGDRRAEFLRQNGLSSLP
ncbi:MAG: hypothetical protein EOP11_06750 [Proteobacteria bacterium]|nr:MAG: hypothetical protein EOP11_06750 [Pseudomonadota bacterium]